MSCQNGCVNGFFVMVSGGLVICSLEIYSRLSRISKSTSGWAEDGSIVRWYSCGRRKR